MNGKDIDNKNLKSKNNVVLIDFDAPYEWNFLESLKEASGEEWNVLKSVSNLNHGGVVQRLIRYLKYFTLPLYVFAHKSNYSKLIAWQQFYGLILAFYFRLFKVKNTPPIYVMTFIYKSKKGFVGKIYEKFMKYIVTSSYINKYICFSKNEPLYYSNIFNVSQEKFVAVNLGIDDVSGKYTIEPKKGYFLTAGRSNRDYNFLISAWKDRSEELEIICDCLENKTYRNIVINNNCHGEEYLNKLANSFAVIVSLDNTDISSGQLVIIQALMFGKPCIVTENESVKDYIENDVNGIIIKKDSKALSEAIEKLNDSDYYNHISNNARKYYLENYSATALGNSVGVILKV